MLKQSCFSELNLFVMMYDSAKLDLLELYK